MKRESFPTHFAGHWIAYLALACICLLVGITAFQLTEPRSDEPRVLLIDAGGALPDMPSDAQVEYPAADSKPEVVQAYVLTTGSGGYDLFIAPVLLLQELYDQQLIQPLAAANALALADGTPIALPLNGEYALCLSHSAGEQAAAALQTIETNHK